MKNLAEEIGSIPTFQSMVLLKGAGQPGSTGNCGERVSKREKDKVSETYRRREEGGLMEFRHSDQNKKERGEKERSRDERTNPQNTETEGTIDL